MSYCRHPWYIWRGGDGIHFKESDQSAPPQQVSIPVEAVRCFLDAWLRRWPAHMTAEGMLKRLAEGDIDPEPKEGEFWARRG